MIKKYFATKDNTITNCFQPNLSYRATGSNAGASDTLQLFSIYGQGSITSTEKARTLISFPVSTLSADRTASRIPLSGSCKFYLNLYNCEHPFTLPKNFYLCVSAITSSNWDEGQGKDDDDWTTDGYCNWVAAMSSSTGITSWKNQGSDYYTGSYVPGGVMLPSYTSSIFEDGTENLRVDITSLVEEWIGGVNNYGMCVYLHQDMESAFFSYYVKKFFGRGTEYFLKQPTLTVEWDDSVLDDRGNFYASSSLCNTENANTIYLYNKPRGSLKNIPSVGTSNIYVQVYTDIASGSIINSSPITGGYVSTGIYSASFALDTKETVVYDRWYNAGLGTCFYTGSIEVKTLSAFDSGQEKNYIVSMPGLRSSYKRNEKPRLKFFIRDKEWSPNIYTIASADEVFTPVKDVYYRVSRTIDKFIACDYGTGSNETRISYGVSGAYFDYDMSGLQEDYMYEFSFIYKRPDSVSYVEFGNKFKFRVEREKY